MYRQLSLNLNMLKNSVKIKSNRNKKGKIISTVISTGDRETGLAVFTWLADNTEAEYAYFRLESSSNVTITTNHRYNQETSGASYAVYLAERGIRIIFIHNHPVDDGVEASDADKKVFKQIGNKGVTLGIYSEGNYKGYDHLYKSKEKKKK